MLRRGDENGSSRKVGGSPEGRAASLYGDFVGVLTDRSPRLDHDEGRPLPILLSLASGFGGVGRPPAEPKNKSFFELELKAGLTAPS
jgi:hypothetical protein